MKALETNSVKSTRVAILRLVVLCLFLVSAVSAQVGGPKDLKSKTGEKAPAATPKTPASTSQRYENEGIAVDFSLKPAAVEPGKDAGVIAGADALATFRVTDTRTGQPITGLHPTAWISSRESEHLPNEAECKDKIRSFLGGLFSVRADIDLNSYLLLTLNHDNTISIINPQISFSRTKLESIVVLPGAGADWVLSKNKEFVYVTMPERSAVAIINTITRKLVSTINTGEKTRPMRVSLQPDGRYVWVGLDGSPLVAVIDTATNKLVSTIKVGAGLHNIAFTANSRFAYVTNSEADTVSAINIKKLVNAAEIRVGKTPVPVAFSTASGLIYVAAINGDSISAIDPLKQQVVAKIPAKRGVVALRFAPEGRFGFVVNQIESAVTVIDASTNSIVNSTQVVSSPDQITFTKGFAYVRGTASEKFSLIDLDDVAGKKLSTVDIQAGQRPPSAMPDEIGVADMIAPAPDGNSAMIANTADMNVYYYSEGMMAPMGTFSNYKRRPHALMIVDRSLAETAPGVYSTPIKLKDAGRFDVPLLIDQPRIAKCFQLEVGDSPEAQKNRTAGSIAVEAMVKNPQVKPGDPFVLRFKITDSLTKQPIAGLSDVRVLAFEPPGVWQQRLWATEIGDGVYEVKQVFPHTGLFKMFIGVASRGMNLTSLQVAAVTVATDAKPADAKNVDAKNLSQQK